MEDAQKKISGSAEFRGPQKEIIEAAIKGEDCLVVMRDKDDNIPEKPCVVISPLISLIEDQVSALTAKGFKACFLGSAQTMADVRRHAFAGKYTFVYMTPELAINALHELRYLNSPVGIGLIAVDEAHCVSEWGHDFRTEYLQLVKLREALPDVPIMALTATAGSTVREEICASLGMKESVKKWVTSFERPNLRFQVSKQDDFRQVLAPLLVKHTNGSLRATVIYALTTTAVEEIVVHLEKDMKGKVSRKESHVAFMQGKISVMVATMAYGMGIDKANIRTVINFGCPSSVEALYQQAGRAGRDGQPSECHLYWSGKDLGTTDFIKDAGSLSVKGKKGYEDGVTFMQAYCNSSSCRHALLVNHFSPDELSLDAGCQGGCDNCERRSRGEITVQDVTKEAYQLLSAISNSRGNFGLGAIIDMLRGSGWLRHVRDGQ
eukprot:gene32367-5059_t